MSTCLNWALSALLATGLTAACGSGDPAPTPAGPRLAIDVAALTLPGLTDACWNLAVTNGLGQTVWSRDAICADDYGDGVAAVSFVGTCDASTGAELNTVTLELVDLFTGTPAAALPASDYVNPCPVGADSCQQTVTCTENADVAVTFNLSVMRDADQGYFDIAMNFEDIFCSAKVDCLERPLLHNPATGERDDTVVVAFGCTAGPGQDTVIQLNSLQIVCGTAPDQTVVATIPPNEGPGNYYIGGNASPSPFLFQAATYLGLEAFPNSVPALNKCFWNLALGIEAPNAGFANCSLVTSATVIDGMAGAGGTPVNTIWPVIDIEVPLTDALGALDCGANPLDGPSSGVSTAYTDFSGANFCYAMDCTAPGGPTVVDVCSAALACESVSTLAGAPVSVDFAPATGLTIGYGSSVQTYALAAGWTASDCCANDCCGGVQ